MGDYSYVTLYVSGNHHNLIDELCTAQGFEPEEQYPATRTPTGQWRGDHVYVWGELRSGDENSELRVILEALRDKGIPYTTIDGGCWGVWAEREVCFDGTTVNHRPLIDGEPVLTETRFRRLMESGGSVAGYFTGNPSQW